MKPLPTEASTNRTPGICAQFLLDLQRHVVDRAQAGAFRRGDAHVELAFVHVAGQIFLPHQLVERHGGGHDQQRQAGHQPAMAHGPAQNAGVGAVNARVETGSGILARGPPSCSSPRPLRARSNRALIIGVSVNDTSRLTSTATADVRPNW